MVIETYKGRELVIFDMYGMLDIRTETTNRTCQVFQNEGRWELHLYWVRKGVIYKHYEVMYYDNKTDATLNGKDWVVDGRWLRK